MAYDTIRSPCMNSTFLTGNSERARPMLILIHFEADPYYHMNSVSLILSLTYPYSNVTLIQCNPIFSQLPCYCIISLSNPSLEKVSYYFRSKLQWEKDKDRILGAMARENPLLREIVNRNK